MKSSALLVFSLNTTVAPLIYADQFLQFSTSLPTQFIYGLGEHRSSFLHDVHWNTLTMWARDVPPMVITVFIVLVNAFCPVVAAAAVSTVHKAEIICFVKHCLKKGG